MSRQSEAILEQKFIDQLIGLGYDFVTIKDEAGMLANLKAQLESFNNDRYSEKEFSTILNHLSKGTVFDKAKSLRERFALKRENEDTAYVRFFDSEDWTNNHFQVTNQITIEGTYKNRYDVTLLVNGLPLVQVELKRRGLELKEAFNQINRYQRHSFWSSHGLFQFVQVFVISNGVNTKYLANNKDQSFKQTFYWADEKNVNISGLTEFTDAFLNPDHLGKMIAQYIVRNQTEKILMVLRPYQYYAVEAIIKQVDASKKNGYIWHTTGSGKTLTSFKASQIITNKPEIHKVVFVVDRKDLDYQTATEFNSFKPGAVDMTENTKSLVDQFSDNTKLIVTTIQKLNNAIKNPRYRKSMEHLQDKTMVFIFDECHRSQFGETHERITEFFSDIQLFGFTGTPIFADNASKNEYGKRTTADLFDEQLHSYVITDAIRDTNVLKFGVEYVGRYKSKSNNFVDIEVEDIDRKEVLESPERLSKIADYIIARHDQKTHSKRYSAIFAVSGIDQLIAYYDIFNEKKKAGDHDLRIATIFTYNANEEDKDADGFISDVDIDFKKVADPGVGYKTSHSRDKLESYIADYNAMYGTNFTTKDSESLEKYYQDIGKRLKKRERKSFVEEDRLDILLVVNMFLTGFDAKMLNTLYVDKNLRYHGLIQAYSRTNRIINEMKSQGNIVCFRNLKDKTDEAIALFSNKNAKEEIFTPDYEVFVEEFNKKYVELLGIASTPKKVDELLTEEDELAFIKAFRELMRILNTLKTYADFSWDDLSMDEQTFEDYKSKYLDLYDKVKMNQDVNAVSILEDVDFELELIHRDEINVAYIIKLLAKLKNSKESDKEAQRKAILEMIGGDVELRSKRELIEKFIQDHLPNIEDAELVTDEFEKYWEEQRLLALKEICEEENLDQQQFRNLIDMYMFTGKEPLKEDVFACLENRPSILQARQIGNRIIERMKEYVDVFITGMVG
ncbi:deoxyribonuclease HsdR [Balneola sp. EhC07]|uniref:type I restriction endonuclease subunit R n=1 Tax=Balneola sp. EhC07 TaxID=1849360 RepID=UPI0007F5600C|nr:type I restriction endonuclease subunit R [Balneola sp. EhC07]OAN61670.1 deoxyribonuclease HsdR [Balneola sp. EhC07]